MKTTQQTLWFALMQFYIREAWLLDERRFREWLDIFTDDVLYFMPRRKNVLRRELHRYTYALMAQITQTAACNRFHVVEQRLARWLLMTHDRMGSNDFLLTQEFLAMMLGVQRTGVSVAAGALQRAGLITYTRGNVSIRDRAGLERRTCECYGVSKREFDRLLRGRTKSRSPMSGAGHN